MPPIARSLGALVLVVAAACATSSQATPNPARAAASVAPATVSMAGIYDFTASAQGRNVVGVMHITGTPGQYAGRIETDVMPTISITSVTTDGAKSIVVAAADQGELRVEMTMDGTAVAGRWYLGGESGSLSGKKRAK